MAKLFSRSISILLLAAVVAFLSACATSQQGSDAPRPGNGIAEYQQLVEESQHAVRRALAALDQVSHGSAPTSPAQLAKFSKEIHRLEIDSIRIRARSQALQDRGNAFFENWHANLARIQDARVRELVGQQRPELEKRFRSVKRISQETRDSFRLFLSGLRSLRNALEKDPGALLAGATKDSARATKEHGQHVETGLAAIGQELQAMRAVVTPGRRADNH